MEQYKRCSPVITLRVYDRRNLGLLEYVSHKHGIDTDLDFGLPWVSYCLYPKYWTDLFPFFRDLFRENFGKNCYRRLTERNYQEFDRACAIFSMVDMYPTDIIRR